MTQTKFNQNLKRMKWFKNEFYTNPPTTLPFCIFFFVFSNVFLLSGTSKLSSLSIVTLFSSLSFSSLSSLSPSASEESVWSFESSFEISWRKFVSSFSLFMFSSSDSSSSLGSSSISSVLSEYMISSLLSFSFASFLISITSCFLLLCLPLTIYLFSDNDLIKSIAPVFLVSFVEKFFPFFHFHSEKFDSSFFVKIFV